MLRFLISKPFLQRVVAVLDLEQGRATFNKLGVTLDLDESATGHHVIDLILGCADLISEKCATSCEASSGRICERF